jgi:putative membrane protein
MNGAPARFKLAAVMAAVMMLIAANVAAQSGGDKKFIVYAEQTNQNAIALDQAAAQKAASADVKTFAQQVTAEHQDMSSTITPFAKEWGVTMPTGPDAATQNELAKLNRLSGAAFDKEYLAYTVSDHKEAYKRFKSEASSTKDAPFRDSVVTSRDRLNDHLTQAEALEKKM